MKKSIILALVLTLGIPAGYAAAEGAAKDSAGGAMPPPRTGRIFHKTKKAVNAKAKGKKKGGGDITPAPK